MISGTAKQRANFTHYHLNSAIIFANCALELEKLCGDDQKKKNETHLDYISYVSSSILTSVAALESNVNELFIDFQEKFKNLPKDKYPDTHKMVKAINTFSSIDIFKHVKQNHKPAIVKYNTLSLLIKGKDIISQKEATDISFIVDLRNSIIHFMPEWDNELKKYDKIEKTYRGQYVNKFSLSPIYNENAMFFPCLCLSSSCAFWCNASVEKFINTFKSEIFS